MDDTLLGTRKGLFTVRGGEIAPVSFLGAPVTAVLSRQEQDVKGTDKRGSVASALFPHTVLSYQNAAGGRYTPPRRGQAASGLAECGLSFGNLQCRAVDNLWFDDCAGRS